MNSSVIVVFSSEFPPLPGGIGNHALHLSLLLAKSGKRITVLTDYRGSDTEVEEAIFDKKLPFPVYRIRRYRIIGFTYLKRCIQAIRLLRKLNSGIVISSGRFQLWLASGLTLFFTKWRFISIIHGSEVGAGGSVMQRLTRWSLKSIHQRIAVSSFTAQLVRNIYPQLPVQIIPNGFAPLLIEGIEDVPHLLGQPALITVGNVSYRKGQHNVIKALPAIIRSFPDVHYHLVGIPTEQIAFLKLAQKLGVNDRVTFHGAVSEARLPVLLKGADIFLMLSECLPNGDVEGFGIAILEANHLGLPAIGSNDSGITDAIMDGYSGRLVSAHDKEAISLAVLDILKNYPKYSEQACDWSKKFLWEKVIVKYLELL